MWREGLRGLLVGSALGAFIGFGGAMWIGEDGAFQFSVTILIGAVVCGVAGFLWGESFFEWLGEWWRRLI